MHEIGRLALLTAIAALPTGGGISGQAQDVRHGENVFRACAACHATDHTNRSGPGLQGIFGRTAGTASGFRYSRAMKESGIVWDDRSLDTYLAAPQKAVPGNRMPFAGLKNE